MQYDYDRWQQWCIQRPPVHDRWQQWWIQRPPVQDGELYHRIWRLRPPPTKCITIMSARRCRLQNTKISSQWQSRSLAFTCTSRTKQGLSASWACTCYCNSVLGQEVAAGWFVALSNSIRSGLFTDSAVAGWGSKSPAQADAMQPVEFCCWSSWTVWYGGLWNQSITFFSSFPDWNTYSPYLSIKSMIIVTIAHCFSRSWEHPQRRRGRGSWRTKTLWPGTSHCMRQSHSVCMHQGGQDHDDVIQLHMCIGALTSSPYSVCM